MSDPRPILILGASYGSLLGTKLALAGHDVTLVCLPAEAEAINAEGVRLRLPVRGRAAPVEIDSRDAPGTVRAAGPEAIDPAAFDLACLAMQEPQFRAGPVRDLLARIGRAGTPVMSIMNMPPLPYLARLPGVDTAALRGCYADAGVWDTLAPAQVTLASPDPQAFRPEGEGPNVLQVSLPTNFKVARFESEADTALLRGLAEDIEAVRHATPEGPVALPVKLKLHDSVFVPLAKWAMLMTGNYRCVTPEAPRSIREAVHGDPALSRAVYDWVRDLCGALGAAAEDLVPFEKYAAAAEGLAKPSSAARALHAGAPAIERLDLLVQTLAGTRGLAHPEVDRTVERVSAKLAENRREAA